MKRIFFSFILITCSTHAFTTYDLPESTQIKKSPQESAEEFQNRIFSTGMVKDLRATLKGDSLNRFTGCLKSSSPFMKNVSIEAISILCYHTGLERVDTGVDYIFTPNKLTIIRYNNPKTQFATKASASSMPSLSYSFLSNPCREVDHNNKGIVNFSPPYQIISKMQKHLSNNPDININGLFIRNAFPKEVSDQIQNQLKSYGVSADKSFIYLKNNQPFICIECPANSMPNGYTCIRGECSIFDSECNTKLQCPQDHILVGDTCVKSCHSQCNKKLKDLKYYHAYTFNPTAHIPYFHLINFLNIPKAHAIMRAVPNLDGLTDQEIRRYYEIRERVVKRLESQILQALSKCDDTPDKDLCSEIPTLVRDDDLSDKFRACKERGGLANNEGVCQPEICYTCPRTYYYDGPTAIAGCSAKETQEAVDLTLNEKNQNSNRCTNGACVHRAISETEVLQTLARLGISCIRTTPARSAPPIRAGAAPQKGTSRSK